jgi:four helix bundle protein
MEIRKYSFEKLEVWQFSRGLVLEIYDTTAKYPSEEKYGLVNQLRRAAVSICSNIAEGSGRYTENDRARFYSLAFSSLMEVLNQIIISFDLNFIDKEKYLLLRSEIQRIGRLLQKLHFSQKNP